MRGCVPHIAKIRNNSCIETFLGSKDSMTAWIIGKVGAQGKDGVTITARVEVKLIWDLKWPLFSIWNHRNLIKHDQGSAASNSVPPSYCGLFICQVRHSGRALTVPSALPFWKLAGGKITTIFYIKGRTFPSLSATLARPALLQS